MPGTQQPNAVGAAALARTAAELRRVTFDCFGEWSAAIDAIEPIVGTAGEWLAQRPQGWIDL